MGKYLSRDHYRNFSIFFGKIENVFDMKKLTDNDQRAIKYIKELEEEIEKLKEYRAELFKQAQLVNETEFKTVVKLERREYNGVTFYINVYKMPKWADVEKRYGEDLIRCESLISESYTGTERRIAINRAEQLAKEYNAIYIHNLK